MASLGINLDQIAKKIFLQLMKKRILVRIMSISDKKNFIRCTLGSLKTTKILTKVIKENI